MDAVDVPKYPHTLNLTRAALYLLEGCLQEMGPCSTPSKVVLNSKVWQKVRRTNNRLVQLSFVPGGHDVEKSLSKAPEVTDLQWQAQVTEWNDAFKDWQDAPVSISMSNKYFDACKDAVKWVFDNKDGGKAKVSLSASIHTATLLVELGLADAEPDEA